jgi:hypothetical protein
MSENGRLSTLGGVEAGTILFKEEPAYHSEITIDPASGAILRLTVVANLEPRLSMLSSAIMVHSRIRTYDFHRVNRGQIFVM